MARHALRRGRRDLERAAEYAATAAGAGSETLAFDRAARLYLMALELVPPGPSTEERRTLQVQSREMPLPTPAAAREATPGPTWRRPAGSAQGRGSRAFSAAPPSSFS